MGASALANQLLLIRRSLGWWSEIHPAEDALNSSVPFCADSLGLAEWLQWIFLPRMKTILESGGTLPQISGIRIMTEMLYAQCKDNVSNLLDTLLGEFDRLIDGQ